MKLIIGNKNYSSWSLRSWLLLSAYDISFEEVLVSLFSENRHEELKKYSGAAKVPVLYDGDTVIWDSLAICEYISEQYLQGRGWPEDIRSRAVARSCCAEMHSGFFAIREALPMNCRALDRKVALTAELEKDITRIDSLWSGLRAQYSTRGPWLFGEFSIVDCMFAPVVSRFGTYNIVVSAASRTYMEQLMMHPKMQLWLEQARAEVETIEIEEAGKQVPRIY